MADDLTREDPVSQPQTPTGKVLHDGRCPLFLGIDPDAACDCSLPNLIAIVYEPIVAGVREAPGAAEIAAALRDLRST